MTTDDDALTAISSWTDDEIRADDVRAAGVLYAAATLEDLKLIELVEHLNELAQNKLLSIGIGRGADMLHAFWDQGYKRMPAKRRTAIFASVLGTPGAADDVEQNDEFAELFERLVTAIAAGDDAGAAATELHANLAEHTDEATTKAAVLLRGTFTELAEVMSDLELRTAYRSGDMWELAENVIDELSGGEGLDVQRARTLATSGATMLRALPELREGATPSDEIVASAKQWLTANSLG
jgi:hypothetical protein